MSSVWEFIKKHRGKLILGGVVVGGIYAGQRYLFENSRLTQVESPFSADGLTLQSRKHYVFDSNQRTCDNSVIQLIPTLKLKLQKRYDIETLLDSLKNGASSSDKVKIWQDMKLMSFIRLISSCYSFTLLIVSLKLQISIIAADIYEKSIQKSSSSMVSNVLEKILGGWFDATATSVKPKPAASAVDASTQQIFLQALHYFITQGSSLFADKIEAIAGEVLNKISLKDELSFDQFQQIFADIRSKININSCSQYSLYVVPLMTTDEITGGTVSGGPSTSTQLDELLVLLKTLLDSAPCNAIVNYCLDEFFDRVFDSCRRVRNDEWFTDDSNGERTSKKIPLAKIIPMVSDCFHHVAETDFDSIVHNILVSSPLHEFCVKIFEKESNLW